MNTVITVLLRLQIKSVLVDDILLEFPGFYFLVKGSMIACLSYLTYDPQK
jgi:hypothetical protein